MACKKKVTSADAAVKAEEIKEEVKAVAENVEEAVKETAAKAKTAGKKAAAKTKTAVEKAVAKDVCILQISGKEEIDVAAITEACKADYKAKGHRMPKAVTVYIKPEEGVAYYTVNGKGAEDFKVTF